MFTTKGIITDITKEDILNVISEYDIFRYYFGSFELKTPYNSPLRKDKNPSFNIFYNKSGLLMYKDFGHSSGDCFSFVQNLFGISYFQALKLIIKDFNLKIINYDNSSSYNSLHYQEIKKEKEQIKLQVDLKPFTATDRDYWQQYGITSQTLNKFSVIACNKVFRNGYKIIDYKDNNPVYAYIVDGKLKIYKPLEINRKYKWMGNITSDSMFGLEQLDLTKHYDYLFITSSLKDIMTLYELGIYAVAPIAEGVYLKDEHVDLIKSITDNPIINFDNDNTGVNSSIKLTERLNCGYWNIPKHYNVKDISDFRKTYGLEQTKELLKKYV